VEAGLKYPEKQIPKTVRDLAGQIKVAILSLPRRKFLTTILSDEEIWDFDGTYYSLEQGVENLRKRFGEAKANQILEMLAQSKAHHAAGWRLNGQQVVPDGPGWQEVCLGNHLLQDTEMVVRDRQPWAYPKDLYRWPTNPWHPELSEADLLNKDEPEN
jgi:hypothetical protein